MDSEKKLELKSLACRIRIGALEAIRSRGFGHVGGCFSIADALAVLYGDVMKYDPKNPSWPQRDKLVCSKGHAGPAVYAALALKGFFPYEELYTLNRPGTILPSHCDRNKTPGVDMTTGSLGQGTSLAVGMALGDKLKGRTNRIFLITGDGELNEGQAWEAAMFAAAKQVNNLVWLVDYNKKQLDGYVKNILNPFNLEEKFRAFGFQAYTIDGNDMEQLHEALSAKAHNAPLALILDTVKGKGVAEIEETMFNHSISAGQEVFDRWLSDLHSQLAALTEGDETI
ncbi:MAG: transketolase [Lachnospiraceae bacterium]|nr:transketolase [Lachnospiraceae bacterium]